MKSRAILTLAAVVVLGSGGALLFAPAQVTATIAPGAAPLVAQFLAAALLGLGASNWIARSSAVGGIYGRALVVGNGVTFGVAALVAIRAFASHQSAALLTVALISAAFAACFAWLLFRGGRM